MAFVCVAPPLIEPVSLSELKDMLRLDNSDTLQDDVLASLNTAARAYCETITQRKFVQQTWALYLDFFPGTMEQRFASAKISSPFVSGANALLAGIRYGIILPCPPVQQLNSFTFTAANGDTSDLMNGSTDPADWSFALDTLSQPARLMPLFGQFWPVAQVRPNAVSVTYTTGYASAVQVSVTANSTSLTNATFTSGNIGQAISIPGAGANGTTLSTVIQSVSGGAGTVRDMPKTAGTFTALLVNYGNPSHWELLKTSIKVLVNAWFVNRLPSYDFAARDAIRALLMPICDKRF
jgi:hypothetical protein